MKFFRVFLLLFLMTLFPLSAEAFRSRVNIFPFDNATEDPAYQNICTTIDQFVTMTLTLLGEHEVFFDNESAGFIPESGFMSRYTEENSVDNVVFGSLDRDDDGNIIISVFLFDRDSGSVTVSLTDTAYSIFDVFDVSENLLSEMIEGFSDIHIGFGTVIFDNRGEKGDYQVLFNGTLMGNNLPEIEKVLNGDYEIEIRQDRLGESVTIYERLVSIREDDEKNIIFSIPFLTEDERARINTLESEIETLLTDGSLSVNYSAVETTEQLLHTMSDLSFCPSLNIIRKSFENKKVMMNAEFVLRQAVSSFNEGEDIRSFYTDDYIPADSSPEVVDFVREAAETIYVLQRLRSLAMLADKEYEMYEGFTDEILSEPAGFTDEFLLLMNNDYIYTRNLYSCLIADRKTRDRKEFAEKLEEYYGEIWEYAKKVGKRRTYRVKGEELLTRNRADSFAEAFKALDSQVVFIPEVEEDGNHGFIFCVGGGTLSTTSWQWHPDNSLLGFRAGLGFSTDIGEIICRITLPVELDFYVLQSPVEVYLGPVTDIVFVSFESGNGVLAFLGTLGVNAGMKFDLWGKSFYFDNRVYYAPDVDYYIMYSPAIGIRL